MHTEVSSHQPRAEAHVVGVADRHLKRSIGRAIHRLCIARRYAAETGRDPWEFAVTIAELLREGVSESDLRWLACRGQIEYATEVASTGPERRYEHRVSLRFSKRTAFIVTEAGFELQRKTRNNLDHRNGASITRANSTNGAIGPAVRPTTQDGSGELNGNDRPKWDQDRRELRCSGRLIKVFKLPSPMQERILIAFEEEHWPPRIDDPLPVHPDLDPKRRLHDTIKSLNRNQKTNLIRFMGDGTGEGIRWELVAKTG